MSYFYYVVAEDGTRSEVTYKVNFVKAQDGETPTEPEEPGTDDETPTEPEEPGTDDETTTPAEDEQKADENKPALGETGSAVLGVSVFALLLAAGSAVIFVMRKRA